MTIGNSDDHLDTLLRQHFHRRLDGVETPSALIDRVRVSVSGKTSFGLRIAPTLAVVAAGAAFVLVLISSRAAEVLLNM
jgi:hypothetical protein